MKKLFIISILLMLTSIIYAQVPQWLWTARGGGIGIDRVSCVATDSQGNVYVAGQFEGTAIFGTTTLTSYGAYDIFVAKLDTNGNWLWARNAGGTSTDYAYGIAVDGSGNVYITGFFAETATFATTTLISYGSYDIFIAKLDTNGYLAWAKQAGGTSQDMGKGITVDSSGNVFVTGYYYGSAQFGTTYLSGYGSEDIFLSKLDSNGNWLWTDKAGSSDLDSGDAVATDSAGNVYVVGYFSGTATFANVTLTSNGGWDMFIAKINPDGYLIAAFKTGGTSQDEATDVALDSEGNVYMTGYIGGTVAFGPYVLTAQGVRDIFVAKMNSGAIWIWADKAGGENWDAGLAIDADVAGNSFSTGCFLGEATFANITLTSMGVYDTFIAGLDANGFLSWLLQVGGTGNDYGQGVAVDNSGNVYIGGFFYQSATFGPTVLTSAGNDDAYVTKIHYGTVANDDDAAPALPALSRLYDAFPNPLHMGETTRIKTYVAKGESGTLSVFNLLGRKVAGYRLKTGSNETSFDSRNLPSGIYFYKLETESRSSVKKLVLLK